MPRRAGSSKTLDAAEHAASLESVAFEEKAFQDFRGLMTRQETSEWLMRLSDLLRTTFCDEGVSSFERDHLARRAHTIVSLSGFLGFAELARLCGALEEACAAGADVAAPFETARIATRTALRTIDTLR